MDPNIQKAFDFTRELSSQMITLAAAIITLTIAFLKDIAQPGKRGVPWKLRYAWSLFLASILFGIWEHMALIGSLNQNAKNVFSSNIRGPALCQISFFFVATFLVISHGWTMLRGGPAPLTSESGKADETDVPKVVPTGPDHDAATTESPGTQS